MALLREFHPFGSDPVSTAQYAAINGRPVMAFASGGDETAVWTFEMPAFTSTLTAKVKIFMASATTGDVDIDGYLEAVTPSDALDLDTTDSFDTVNSTDNTSVPGTAGYMIEISVTLTNNDSISAGDLVRFKLVRPSGDTAAGDMYLALASLYDAS